MASRRQEKMASVVKEAISDAINNLSDPRISGLVSVTHVDVSPDMKNADIYLSVFGVDEKEQNLTIEAIESARNKIQGFLAHEMRSKFCPSIRLHKDDKFKKTLETLKLIDEVAEKKQQEDENKKDEDSD